MMYKTTYTCILLIITLTVAESFEIKNDAVYGRDQLAGQNNTHPIEELIEGKIQFNEKDDDDDDDDYQQIWYTFIQNMIDRFYHQREPGTTQFGFIFLANPENQLADQLIPHDANNNPILDNTYALSPNNQNHYVNYVAARPDYIPELAEAIHAEDLILGTLSHLWNRYLNRFGRTPTFILLYSWIMPCPDCTQLILNYFQAQPYANVQHRMVVHSTEGLNLDYMSWEGNNESRNRMRAAGIGVITHRCYSLPPSLLSGEKKNKSADDVNKMSIKPILGFRNDFDQCLESETVQGCMFSCLDESASCCSKTNRAKSALATYVNKFMSDCGDKDMEKCAHNWINDNIGNACGCIRHSELQNQLNKCLKTCKALPMSNPLSPANPTRFTGILQDMNKLKHFPPGSVECKDNRMEGLLCSQYKASFLTAGNSLCRQDSECGYHGKSYSWCYTDYSNHWDYCCTDACLTRSQSYLWCNSGSKWQYCGNAGTINVAGRRCLASSPCGLHLDEKSSISYYWCYEDIKLNWQYCCQPTFPCGKLGGNWCYTGYKIKTNYKTCKK